MADASVVHIGENSPEEVAYKLFWQIAAAEKKRQPLKSGLDEGTSRKWVLDTYAECLEAVRGGRSGSVWSKLAE